MMQRCTQLYHMVAQNSVAICIRCGLTRTEIQNFKDSKVGLNSNCSFRLVGKEGVAEGCDLETARSSIN